MAKRIRLGILGCSNIAERAVIPALMESPSFEVVKVASRSVEKGALFRQKFGADFCTYDELIQSHEIDAIYVSLPVGLHYEWGKKVIESGKHLLMEKTFTTGYDQALEIIDLAKQQHLIAMEALMYTHHPLFAKVEELVKQGAVGAVRSIEAFFGFPELPENDIRNQKDLGGGAILDSLIYPLSLCLNLAQETDIHYDYRIFKNKRLDVDHRGSLYLHFKNFSAYIAFGFGFMYRNEYTVWGSQGYLTVSRGFSRPADMAGEIKLVTQNHQELVLVDPSDHFKHMAEAFYMKILGKDQSATNEGDSILNRMRIISDIYLAYQQGGEE